MEKEKQNKKKKQKHQHPNDDQNSSISKQPTNSDLAFKPVSDVKGLRFGAQFIVKSFTVRRARPLELLKILSLPNPQPDKNNTTLLSSTTSYLPTNFTILAHRAWHTLTLGLGTKKSKVLIFVFESEEAMRATASSGRPWPPEIALGEVNKRLIRGLFGFEMARFKFRKGCVTFYVYAVRRVGSFGFTRADDLRTILQTVVDLKDFVDHTAMLATPKQRSIDSYAARPDVAMAH